MISYGLVFGFNTFLALLLQTLLTSVVADSAGLALPPRTQFQVIIIYSLTHYHHHHYRYRDRFTPDSSL